MKESFQIGWYVLKEDEIIRDNGYECAAWYQDVKVKAGYYPVTGKLAIDECNGGYRNEIDYNSIHVKLNGVIIADDFVSRYYGMPLGSDYNKHVGEESDIFLRPYSFTVAEHIMNNTGKYILCEGFNAVKKDFTDIYGKPSSTNKIVCTEERMQEIKEFLILGSLTDRINKRITSSKDLINNLQRLLPEGYTITKAPPLYKETCFEIFDNKGVPVINVAVNEPPKNVKWLFNNPPLIEANLIEDTPYVPKMPNDKDDHAGISSKVASAKLKAAVQNNCYTGDKSIIDTQSQAK